VIYLLSYSHSPYGDHSSTAKKLAREANWNFITSFSNPEFTKDDILIRYGVYKHPEWDSRVKVVFNSARSIRLNCCKALTHYLLEHSKIRVPRMWFLPSKIPSNKFPILSRHKYHAKGKDIRIIKSYEELSGDYNAFYFVELIHSEIEYRIHILRDKCIRLSRKLPMRTRENVHPFIRSFSRGWKLRDKTGWNHIPDLEDKAIKECKRALKVLGLDFGAIDVVIQKETELPYILEVNTAPRLNKLGRKKYLKAFKNLLGSLK